MRGHVNNTFDFDSIECARKSCAENYPRNFALIKLAQKHEALKAEEAKK